MSEPERTIIKLKRPITLGSEVIDELAFRRGRMGDLKGLPLRLDDVPWDALMTVAGRLTGQPTAVIERIDAEDAGEVVSRALGFYMGCLTTGPTG